MKEKFNFIEKLRIKRDIKKKLNISPNTLTDNEIIFLKRNELINENNVEKVLELYRTIGSKNTLLALNNNLLNLEIIDIMNKIIQDLPKEFEVLNNEFFSSSFPGLYENNTLTNIYREKGIISFQDYNNNKTKTAMSLPIYFFSPLVQKFLTAYKTNENVINYSSCLTNMEKNQTISIENYVTLLNFGIDLQNLDFNIKVTKNNNQINEKYITESLEVVSFLMENKLWNEYSFSIDLNNNPYEELLNYMKSRNDMGNKEIEYIYDFIQKKCNLYTAYNLLTPVEGKYVLKNNSEILTDNDIYNLVDKKVLDVLNIDVERLKKYQINLIYKIVKL